MPQRPRIDFDPIWARCHEAVYILCSYTPTLSLSPPPDGEPTEELDYLGTSSATGPTQVLSAAHNIPPFDGTDIKYLLMKSVSVDAEGKFTYTGPRIEVKLVESDEPEDWAVFKRTDGQEFENWIPPCPKKELPHRDGYGARELGIYHIPLGVSKQAQCSWYMSRARGVDGLQR